MYIILLLKCIKKIKVQAHVIMLTMYKKYGRSIKNIILQYNIFRKPEKFNIRYLNCIVDRSIKSLKIICIFYLNTVLNKYTLSFL